MLTVCSELEADVFGNEVYASNCHMAVSTVPSLSVAGHDDKTEVSLLFPESVNVCGIVLR